VEGVITSFECDGCRKSYRWKPELAGKKVKCKCGHPIVVPIPAPEPPQAVESDDPFADALAAAADAEERGAYEVAQDAPRCPGCIQPMAQGAMVCVHCGYNLKTGKKLSVSVDQAGAPAKPAPAKKAAAGVLPYQRPPAARFPGRAEANNNVGEPVKDLYIPIGLFLLGVILSFIETKISWGFSSYSAAFTVTSIFVVLNIFLVFVAIMMAVKLMDLGLGPVGPAMLKIAVVAVLPGAVAGVATATLGFSGGWFGRIGGLILTYALFMWLLELDYHETNICAVIIWLVRTFGTYLLIFALVGALGISAQRVAPLTGGGSGASARDDEYGEFGGRNLSAKEMDTLAARLLASSSAIEARAWIAGAPPEKRRFYLRREMTAKVFVDSLYSMGARRITVTLVKSDEDGEWANQLVIEMPASSSGREKILDWNDDLTHIMKYDSVTDTGFKYLVVNYDGKQLSELFDGSGKKKRQ
jgi:hypothetical protein